jgi:hypothetical protein
VVIIQLSTLDDRKKGRTRGVIILGPSTGGFVEQARRRCGASAPVGKVISELQLGFWRYLTSSAHEKTLWFPMVVEVSWQRDTRSAGGQANISGR